MVVSSSSKLQVALQIIRDRASSTTEQGKAFERLVKVFLENDPTQKQQYNKVWHYADWAQKHTEYPSTDTGIDLVAEMKDEEGFCAIQCKFYQPGSSITKASMDSFISASSTSDFVRLILIDTTDKPIQGKGQKTLENLGERFRHLSLNDLKESPIDWIELIQKEKIHLDKKKIRPDQKEAVKKVKEGLAENDRGKMIMACGVGKTFTSLRIAEEIAGAGKMVLYMVPSLALMSQAIREWKNDASEDITAFSVCSDSYVGRRQSRSSDDKIELNLNELALPATTDARKLSKKIAEKADKSQMTVVFSTYQSIDVISQSQKKHDLGEFDLIICDEAHRTTGATFEGDEESNFVKIHDDKHVEAKKRLYMTATPRIYGDKAKKKEEEGDVTLASMDDEKVFGKTLISRNFGWAVEHNLLTDYKVVVLAADEQVVSNQVQKAFTEGSELKLDDATKMVGCYKALAKIGITEILKDEKDKKPMKRALAFCRSIALSEMVRDVFEDVVDEYTAHEEVSGKYKTDLNVELDHVDGKHNAQERTNKLDWLKENTDENVCRILSNAKCLSEGVDVPALDAVMFLHPRKSQIEVVQAVGRVMRKAEGKDLGYVILPVAVAPGVSPEKALNDNERYKVVWQILNALRAHDERMDGKINQLGLGEDVSGKIQIIDVTAVTEDVRKKSGSKGKGKGEGKGGVDIGEGGAESTPDTESEQPALFADLSQAIKAKIVDKCGTRDYWENWASDIAKIAEQHIIRIKSIVKDLDTPARKAFEGFLAEIRDDLNPVISENDAVEMLAQHIITRPVFDTLFQGNKFTSGNAVSKAMEKVLSQIYEQNIEAESESLEKFYASVKRRAADIKSAKGRQALILELYDRFFRSAFPKMTAMLGIIYTPVEVVDFIVHSVEDVMRDEFNSSLGDAGVDILDPFAGTGTFISRLLQSGILSEQQIKQKFTTEIHANEIVLLAYYIACINIEGVYADLVKDDKYKPFKGMVLTDTFQLFEQDSDMIANLLPDNSERRTRQKKRKITVVIGNPPYSVGQKDAGDNAANVKYPNLDKRVKTLYVEKSSATNKNALYDSYVKAFRWASDRVRDKGVIGFITNSGWIDGNAFDAFRERLSEEFNKVYVFSLRGGIRGLSGDSAKKEGGNVFNIMAGVAVVILVKNGNSTKKGKIYYHNIKDYLNRKQKFEVVKNFKSIKKIQNEGKFTLIRPDEDNDWINQRDKSFNKHLPMGDKSKQKEKAIFETYSRGIATGCDAWVFNSSKSQLQETIRQLVDIYNEEMQEYQKRGDKSVPVNRFVDTDPKKIAWGRGLFQKVEKGVEAVFDSGIFLDSLYRPFHKQILYYDKHFSDQIYRLPSIFKDENTKNLVIGVETVGSKEFSCLVTDRVPDLHLLGTCQFFPFYLVNKEEDADMITSANSNFGMRNAINPEVVKDIGQSLGQKQITNKMLFQYIYAVLHSQEYRNRYANNLSKELPRIPIVKTNQKFFDLVEAGKELIRLHVDYEKVEKHPITIKQGSLDLATIEDPKSFFYVKQMKFPNKHDKSTVFYNENITMQDIPLEAYEYVVNQKPSLGWIMDRQCVKVDKKSGIKNDANDYANETMNNPAYPLELFQRVITVSLETMKIIKSLPSLDLD